MPIRKDDKGHRIIKGARDARTFEWEGIQVREDRRPLLHLLLEAAGRLANCERQEGWDRLMCLGTATNLRTTIVRWLKEPIVPRWAQLSRIADQTEVPLPRFLVVLDITDEAELAAALEQQAPDVVPSPEQRRWQPLIDSLDPEESDQYFDYLSKWHRWVLKRQRPPPPTPDQT